MSRVPQYATITKIATTRALEATLIEKFMAGNIPPELEEIAKDAPELYHLLKERVNDVKTREAIRRKTPETDKEKENAKETEENKDDDEPLISESNSQVKPPSSPRKLRKTTGKPTKTKKVTRVVKKVNDPARKKIDESLRKLPDPVGNNDFVTLPAALKWLRDEPFVLATKVRKDKFKEVAIHCKECGTAVWNGKDEGRLKGVGRTQDELREDIRGAQEDAQWWFEGLTEHSECFNLVYPKLKKECQELDTSLSLTS
ncbi:hypothetical protein CYLTODRAFT_410614 [Cylindrobasidium torrendii FP15055 ss-10]|uniref:Uncharacterized protein n=1 Tax=Cylindrobasidium torrendii FP15055 ss-10 TaxID=1314674 RepID=A0A0D7BC61_9AGAR|nr:hypothetical protein CYLTODRAFT_410614 [Cylindrobasidium torrendii FP15055 ss-10]